MKVSGVTSALLGLLPLVSALNPKKVYQRMPIAHRLELDPKQRVHAPLLTTYSFDQLIDHANPSLGTFSQKFWLNAEFYKKDGPIVVFTPGESNAAPYTGYLTNRTLTGYLAQNFSGAVVMLEHRYWGDSRPTPDLSTKNLKYLTVENSVEDLNYFANNVKLPFANLSNTSPTQVPWIFVGGSYSGVLAAYVNVHPNNAYWASWATSAPVEPVWDYWAYFYPIMEHMTQNCSADVQRVIEYVDDVLMHGTHKEVHELKALFGMENITHRDDFADALPIGIYNWQDQQAYTGYSDFWAFCDALEHQNGTVAGPDGFGLEPALAAYGNWMKGYWPGWCGTDDAQECFGSHVRNVSFFKDISYAHNYRQWYWLICNEFGYWQDGAPAGKPTIVSRLANVTYSTHYCNMLFPGGEKQGAAPPPLNAADREEYGGWNIEGNRLFIVNAGGDPWRDASTASDFGPYGENPPSTPRQIQMEIKDGIHCWDLIVANWIDPFIPPIIDAGVVALRGWLAEFQPS